ncbi:MAG: V-type ATP synthase subunit D [Oscillospiraceae bacterium]|jgi:V/A-type H+-transporting ATPase subunit D|nr:V-type ATP synthase subunit D [Oscillospiraceae bacterium]
MAQKTITPTRMELTRLKARLKTAVRGHKLLKDKRDELMRQFLEVVRRTQSLRSKVDAGLDGVGRSLSLASAVMSTDQMEQALLYPRQRVELSVSTRNIMSVRVPKFDFRTSGAARGDIFPYGFAQTSGELDDAIIALSSVFSDMLSLAEAEKTTQLLADEIERTRRRVNALEYVMIPEMQTNIKYITMKLEENDRSTKVRLMKVKDMVLEQSHNYQ